MRIPSIIRLLTIYALLLLGLPITAYAQKIPTGDTASDPSAEIPVSHNNTKRTPKPLAATYSYFPWENEALYYSVRFNGVETMRAKVQVGTIKKKKDGLEYVAIAGTLRSVGLFSSIYSVNDKADSFISPYSGQIYRSLKDLKESKGEQKYDVTYLPKEYTAAVKRSRDGDGYDFTRAIPMITHDMLSWFFSMRRLYPLVVGEPLDYYIYDGWKISHCVGEVLAKEEILTDMGWFKTYKIRLYRNIVSITMGEDGKLSEELITKGEQAYDIWVTRDEMMIPVKFSMATPWGSADLILIKYKPPKDFHKPKPDRKTWRRTQSSTLPTPNQ